MQMAKKIIITIGHGTASDGKSYDSGALSKDKKYQEFKIAKEIGKYAQKYYNEHYAEHCDLMNYDGGLSLQERINKLKDDTYDFIAEIHLNAGGGTGTECYYHHQSEKGRKYADAICKNIASALGVKQRNNGTDDGGDKTKLNAQGNDYFGIIRSTKPCAVLVETVFIDNDSDLAKVKTAAGQKKCGEAIAKAIASVRGLKESKKATAAKAETKSKFPYKVKITATELNVRAGAGLKYKVKTAVHKNEVYTIVAEKDGWGKLLSGAGWLKLSFTKRV
jgi:N-acetylmuramoyl-L-alanine amidase